MTIRTWASIQTGPNRCREIRFAPPISKCDDLPLLREGRTWPNSSSSRSLATHMAELAAAKANGAEGYAVIVVFPLIDSLLGPRTPYGTTSDSELSLPV